MNKEQVIKKIEYENSESLVDFFSCQEKNLQLLEDKFQVQISTRGNQFCILGEEKNVNRATSLIPRLLNLIKQGAISKGTDIRYIIQAFTEDENVDLESIFLDRIEVPGRKSFIRPKGRVQQEYIQAIRDYDIVFGIGPAGTGKTYLAMAMAVSSLMKKQVSRIILARPAVEAGEKLGFLPGDLQEKVNPYLRPLYDALYDMMDTERANRLIEKDVIEIAPLAYMRGRTLNDAFAILDEAQNTTSEQMKMFLTRLGFGSKAVITGDITQIDLPADRPSGLVEVQSILKKVQGIRFIYFSELDVVRHSLVQKIIKAYESYEHDQENLRQRTSDETRLKRKKCSTDGEKEPPKQ
ncbi:MAG: PhoH family protein [bacterium]|nr:PhoH family protein [bacterium]